MERPADVIPNRALGGKSTYTKDFNEKNCDRLNSANKLNDLVNRQEMEKKQNYTPSKVRQESNTEYHNKYMSPEGGKRSKPPMNQHKETANFGEISRGYYDTEYHGEYIERDCVSFFCLIKKIAFGQRSWCSWQKAFCEYEQIIFICLGFFEFF